MKVWKKLSAVALALMMVLALCVLASADEEATPATLSAGVAKNTTTNAAIANTLTIPKAITVTGSTDLSKVYTPAVTYAYTVSAANVTGITVDDSAEGNTHTPRPVKAGILGETNAPAVAVPSVTFPASEVTLTSGSGTVSGNVTVTVDLTKFAAAGIYRYEITEDATNTTASRVGVTHTADHFFLDVYIKNDDSGTNGLSVYGFVLLSANQSITTSTASQYKVSTFTTDTYATKDITLTNTVTGNMGDKTHQFPFNITVSNNNLGYFYAKNTSTLTDSSTTALAETSSTTLANGETFYIKGLNPNATVTFTETNNSSDEYTVSVSDGGTSVLVNPLAVTATGTRGTDALPVLTYSRVTFINALDAISPTGVALRYAPYLAMLGAGVVALPLSRRKKEEEL